MILSLFIINKVLIQHTDFEYENNFGKFKSFNYGNTILKETQKEMILQDIALIVEVFSTFVLLY